MGSRTHARNWDSYETIGGGMGPGPAGGGLDPLQTPMAITLSTPVEGPGGGGRGPPTR